jgi:hypothetical protein
MVAIATVKTSIADLLLAQAEPIYMILLTTNLRLSTRFRCYPFEFRCHGWFVLLIA